MWMYTRQAIRGLEWSGISIQTLDCEKQAKEYGAEEGFSEVAGYQSRAFSLAD